MPLCDTLSRALADRDGAAATELALIAPVLILFVIGLVDVGALAYQKAEVLTAVDAGELYAIHKGGGSLANIQSAVTNATPLSVTPTVSNSYTCAGGSFSSSYPTGCAGTIATYVQINAQASYAPLISWGTMSFPTTLSASAIVRTK